MRLSAIVVIRLGSALLQPVLCWHLGVVWIYSNCCRTRCFHQACQCCAMQHSRM